MPIQPTSCPSPATNSPRPSRCTSRGRRSSLLPRWADRPSWSRGRPPGWWPLRRWGSRGRWRRCQPPWGDNHKADPIDPWPHNAPYCPNIATHWNTLEHHEIHGNKLKKPNRHPNPNIWHPKNEGVEDREGIAWGHVWRVIMGHQKCARGSKPQGPAVHSSH